ncbi:MAG: amidoligase family protein [Candidatus Nanopelagicus sp.]
MRAKEFIIENEVLDEVSMSPTSLKQMAKKVGATAGMEFELIIPNASQEEDYDDYDMEPDYDYDESFPTGRGWERDVIRFFTNGDYGSSEREVQRELDKLTEKYWDWKSEQFDNWLSNNYSKLRELVQDQMSPEEDESDDEFDERVQAEIDDRGSDYDRAYDELREEFESEDNFDEFLSDEGIDDMTDFASQFDLQWPYMTEPSSSGGSVSIDNVAEDFQQAIGRPVNASSSYHGGRREAGHYVVEPDSSLEGDNSGDGGLEFVSPPLPLDEMLSDLDKVAKWADRTGAYTNDSTGLHMNVSIPNFSKENLDYVKLAIFLGDEYILDQFGRTGNTYCKSAMKAIKHTARTEPDKVKTMLQQMQGSLSAMASKIVHTGSTSKYTSINTKEGYIEFRSPGGDWLGEYDADPTKVTNTLLRFVVALDIAMKPELYRQEYMKKLYKTLDQGDGSDTIQLFAKFAAGEMPKSELKDFIRNAQAQRKKGKEEKEQTDTLYKELAGVSREQLPPVDFNGNYEVYAVGSGNAVYRFRVDNTQEAYAMLQRWRQTMMHPNLDPREYNVRAVAQQPDTAQGTGSLPSGNQRWMILDQNDREVYSFVHRNNQAEANQYATNWLQQNRQGGEGSYTVVPAR